MLGHEVKVIRVEPYPAIYGTLNKMDGIGAYVLNTDRAPGQPESFFIPMATIVEIHDRGYRPGF